VVEVLDLEAILSATPAPSTGPRLSFDEPPLASRIDDPRSPQAMPGPGIVQATFVDPKPGFPERAPMPRRIRSDSPFSSPADPF
jgi:hypothetical protein